MNTKMTKTVFSLCVITLLIMSCGLGQIFGSPPPPTQTLATLLTSTPVQAITLVPTPTSTFIPTETHTPASGEWFVYSSTMDDNDGDDTSETDIYFARLDGSELLRLTDFDGDDYEPDLSPDGQRVLFVSGGDVYKIDVDGSDMTRLTEDPATDNDPAWSSDGTKIVFVSDRGGGSQIYTMNADGSGVIHLTDDEAEHRDPAWSPDGTKIAYVAVQEKLVYDIYVMDADGSNQRKVTSDSNLNLSPAWSSDGSQLAYTSWSADNIDKNRPLTIFSTRHSEQIFLLSGGGLEKLVSSIRVIALDGTDMRQLTEDGVSSWSPCWSPDGSKIIFAVESNDGAKIFIMNADGTGKIPLTTGDGSDYSPSW